MEFSDERREVAKRLRALPTDLYSELCELEEQGVFVDTSRQDEVDYSLIHNVILGCLPAEHMHPCDYQELHERLADLIDPVCTPVVDDVYGMPDELVCSECGCCLAITVDGKPSAPLSRYCPCCGARIVEEDQ